MALRGHSDSPTHVDPRWDQVGVFTAAYVLLGPTIVASDPEGASIALFSPTPKNQLRFSPRNRILGHWDHLDLGGPTYHETFHIARKAPEGTGIQLSRHWKRG